MGRRHFTTGTGRLKVGSSLGLLLCACLLTGPAAPAQQLPWQDYQAKAKAAFENGHLADAEQFYSAAISEGEKARAGAEDISALLSGLAAVYAQLGKPDQTAPLYRKSLRTLERSKGLRKQRETLSSVSLTCFGGVSSDLPFRAIQILQHHGIVADKYVLSPHSVNLFVPVESREAAVKALHSLI